MKKINIKQPKYVIPIIVLPFFIFAFYLYKDAVGDDKVVVIEGKDGFQGNLSKVSSDVDSADLRNKLDAFEMRYKDGDGYTAVNEIGNEKEGFLQYNDPYSNKEKRQLDSLEYEFKQQQARMNESNFKNKNSGNGYLPNQKGGGSSDDQLRNIINNSQRPLSNSTKTRYSEEEDNSDPYNPVKMMKEQFRVLDSIEKANDPERLAELKRIQAIEKLEKERAEKKLNKMTVQKANLSKYGFNTIKAKKDADFIKAIIDENIKGYAGSRLRIKLLEDIQVGQEVIKRGTYLYALVTAFNDQRVGLSIYSVVKGNNIYPINLDVYDMDGMQGLYIPSSSFREFTKELGTSSLQGVQMNGDQSDFLMSTAGKAFQSTSTAMANALRRNKAKFKYNTFVYLIDSQELKK